MIFVRALIFGVTLAVAIGPIALLIIRYAATEGLTAGLASASEGAALGRLLTGRRSIQLLNAVSGVGIVLFGVAGLFR